MISMEGSGVFPFLFFVGSFFQGIFLEFSLSTSSPQAVP